MVTKNKFQLYLVSRQFGMPGPWIWNFTNCLGYKTKVKMLVIDLELYELSWIQNYEEKDVENLADLELCKLSWV